MKFLQPAASAALAAVLFGGLVASAAAQTTPAPKPPSERAREGMFSRADVNKDGFVDRNEWQAQAEIIFARLDANADGRVSKDEVQAARDKLRAQRAAKPAKADGETATTPTAKPAKSAGDRAQKLFDRQDANKDGFVTKAEFVVASNARFDRCDANKDGKLAVGECKLARQAAPKPAPATTK
jgi:hypothetical protein